MNKRALALAYKSVPSGPRSFLIVAIRNALFLRQVVAVQSAKSCDFFIFLIYFLFCCCHKILGIGSNCKPKRIVILCKLLPKSQVCFLHCVFHSIVT